MVDEFLRGYGSAMAALAIAHDQPTMAADLLCCDNIMLDDLIDENTTEYDREGFEKIREYIR